MAQTRVLDPSMIPDRITSGLPLPLIEEMYAEAVQIRKAEAQLQMRRVVLVTKLREKGMSWDSCGWFFGATGEAVRKVYGVLIGDGSVEVEAGAHGRPGST
jgi:hypothetical protein